MCGGPVTPDLRECIEERKIRLHVLVGCRDNPLAEDLKRSIGITRAAGVQRGLARIDSPQGMMVAFSTQAQHTAEDGSGRNSRYTTAFLKHIEEPGEVGLLFRRISTDVSETTEHQQLPELSLSMIGQYYFRKMPPPSASMPVPSQIAADPALWNAAKDTDNASVLEAFIAKFGWSG